MIVIKRLTIPNSDGATVEKTLRRCSLRRHTPLDLLSSANHSFDVSKLFLGYETDKKIQFTRLRGPIDRYFPKFILVFGKDDFTSYKIRYCFISLLGFLFLSLLALVVLALAVTGIDFSGILPTLILVAIFAGLSFLEYKATTININLAIARMKESGN
ncbi:MAG TPA: hypothetical protein VK174_04345 [Chitinophagales bacterium]|nr:hypothetical protein [Chitinophagales bacterium]